MTPQDKLCESDNKIYLELKEIGSRIETESFNKLESPFIETICATLDYFGVDRKHIGVTKYLLQKERMKVCDYLGMAFVGRLDLLDSEVENINFKESIAVMVKLYILQKNVGGFAWWLRGHDLDMEKPSHCDDCIKSYADWHKEQTELTN